MTVQGKLFVISAPSGAGKSTLLRRVMADVRNLVFSISHTTRQPRQQEQDGVAYHFVDTQTFETMIAEQQFLEFAHVHNNYYGTSRPAIEAQLAKGLDVVLDIDVQGAAILREQASFPASYIFVAPPTFVELEKRLRGRGTESEESISLRLENARTELESAALYEYLVVNDDLDEAAGLLRGIILAERAKDRRGADGRYVGDFQ